MCDARQAFDRRLQLRPPPGFHPDSPPAPQGPFALSHCPEGRALIQRSTVASKPHRITVTPSLRPPPHVPATTSGAGPSEKDRASPVLQAPANPAPAPAGDSHWHAPSQQPRPGRGPGPETPPAHCAPSESTGAGPPPRTGHGRCGPDSADPSPPAAGGPLDQPAGSGPGCPGYPVPDPARFQWPAQEEESGQAR